MTATDRDANGARISGFSRLGCPLVAALLLAPSLLCGAPRFSGARSAAPSFRAVVLKWDKATNAKGAVSYRIYRSARGMPQGRPLASTTGTAWAMLGAAPGQKQSFIVRAADSTGEESNARVVAAVPLSQPPAAETRAAWVSRFDWAGGTKAEMQQRIRQHFDNLRRAHFNTVFFQCRGGCQTLYPSREEPWDAMIATSARDWDPLGFAVKEAHDRGLQLHAWINLSTAWQSKDRNPPPKGGPGEAAHVFFRHLDAANPAKRDWLIHDRNGRPIQWGADEYVWLAPGNPDAAKWVRERVIDVVRRYDIDGLHFDDRTGAPNGESHDPVSVRRFRASGAKDFRQWQLGETTRSLLAIETAARAIKPGLLFSAAPFGIYDRKRIPGYGRFSDCLDHFGEDPLDWLRKGAVDTLAPQIYWDLPDPEPNFDVCADDWLALAPKDRPLLLGFRRTNTSAEQLLSFIAYSRARKAAGFSLFDIRAMTTRDWDRLRAVLDHPVPPRQLVTRAHR